uniref:Uncharacterized protein n=1 Tax=Cannabis sativa TaxID=3483 RepID=A0A803PSD0_CANSA
MLKEMNSQNFGDVNDRDQMCYKLMVDFQEELSKDPLNVVLMEKEILQCREVVYKEAHIALVSFLQQKAKLLAILLALQVARQRNVSKIKVHSDSKTENIVVDALASWARCSKSCSQGLLRDIAPSVAMSLF